MKKRLVLIGLTAVMVFSLASFVSAAKSHTITPQCANKPNQDCDMDQ
ncbi:hypothetical protein NYE48_27470 [Paenibacillus sp. FSL M7-1455]